MTKMSFVLTMVLCLILASFTNLNASSVQSLRENNSVNLSLKSDVNLPTESYFIKGKMACDKNPNGLYISTIVNKEGQSLSDLEIVLNLDKQKIKDLYVTYADNYSEINAEEKTPNYNLVYNEDFDFYTIVFSEVVSQPLKVIVESELLLVSIMEGAINNRYTLYNEIEVYAKEYQYPIIQYFEKDLKLSTYVNLELISQIDSTYTFNLNFKSLNENIKEKIIINFDKDLILSEASSNSLKKDKDLSELEFRDNEIEFSTQKKVLNVTFDLKIKNAERIDLNKTFHVGVNLSEASVKDIVSFSYSPINIENAKSTFSSDKKILETSFVLKSDDLIDDFKIQVKNEHINSTSNFAKVIVEDLENNKQLVEGIDFTYGEISQEIYFNKPLKQPNIKVRYTTTYNNIQTHSNNTLNFFVYARINNKIDVVKAYRVDPSLSGVSVDVKNTVVGSYEAINKVITWEVIANFHDNLTSKNIINTVFSQKEKFLVDDLKIIQYKVLSSGELIFVKDLKAKDYNIEFDDKDNSLCVKIKNIQPSVYKLIIKTSLTNTEIDYQAYHLSQIKINDEVKEIKNTLTIPYINLHINKLGKQEKATVDWTILVNEKQSSLPKVEVVDSLCKNQKYLKDSLKIYRTLVNSDGSYVVDKNPLKLSEYTIKYFSGVSEGFILNLSNLPINIPYLITYKTIPKLNKSVRLVNSASLNNFETAIEVVDYLPTVDKTEDIEPTVPESFRTSLLIKSLSEDLHGLSGGIFSLSIKEDSTYTKVIDDFTINKEVNLKGLQPGEYRLSQIKPVENYIHNLEHIDFEILINQGREVKFISYQGQLLVYDRYQKHYLSGAQFNIIDLNNNIIDLFTLNKNPHPINHLVPKDYILNSLSPTLGYKHINEKIEFNIKAKAYGQPKPVVIYVSSEKLVNPKKQETSDPVKTSVVNNKVIYLASMMVSLMYIIQYKRKNRLML